MADRIVCPRQIQRLHRTQVTAGVQFLARQICEYPESALPRSLQRFCSVDHAPRRIVSRARAEERQVMYSIRYVRELDLLDISWSGLFTPEGMTSYVEDCWACWKREQFRAGYRLRITLEDGQPLPQDTLRVLAGAFADFPKSRRAAMVVNGAVAGMQIRRAMMEPHMRIFETSEAALEWLLSP